MINIRHIQAHLNMDTKEKKILAKKNFASSLNLLVKKKTMVNFKNE